MECIKTPISDMAKLISTGVLAQTTITEIMFHGFSDSHFSSEIYVSKIIEYKYKRDFNFKGNVKPTIEVDKE